MGQDVFRILKNVANRPMITVQDVRDWASIIIENIRNDESGWSENGRQISEAGKDAPAENPSIAVLIDFAQTITSTVVVEDADAQLADAQSNAHPSAKQHVAPTDIALNLQYFFPYCDQAFFNNPNVRVILIVICANKQDEQRVKCYLSAIGLEKPQLCICTTVTETPRSISDLRLNSIQPAAITYGALLPLVCVGQGPPTGSNNNQFSLTSVRLGTSSDSFYCYITSKQKRSGLQNVQLAQFLEAGYHIIDDINNYFTSSTKTPDKLAILKKNRADLWSAVHRDSAKSQIKRLPLITQLIWLCSIRFMLYQDLQWDRDNISGFLSRMELLLWDSIAYGEGILQLLENSELHSQHHCGYLSIYFHRVALNRISEIAAAADRRIRIFHKYRYNPSDSFTSSSENIYLEFNIIDMGRNGEYQARGIPVISGKNLKDLFYGDIMDTDPMMVAHHYGLPLFFKTVILKNGRFICTSPKSDQTTVQLIGRRKEKKVPEVTETELNTSQGWTGYQVLLPLTLNPAPTEMMVSCKELFDSSYLKDEIKPSQYSCHIIPRGQIIPNSANTYRATDKITSSQTICDKLYEIISNPSPTNVRFVYVMKITDLSSLQLEICLKGIFLLITRCESRTQKLLLRLVFSDEFAISEAIRRFSIFYNKAGENKWMEHVQIAICNESEIDAPVRLVLAGNNITSAYITAKQYMQYNINLDSGYLCSQIEYLTLFQTLKNDQHTFQPLFPFDLVKFNFAKGTQLPCRSDFERKIDKMLNTDFQSNGYGCKITNAHIRLGSKLHIRDFYDAELLFQSMANTYRFAYLLAEKILETVPKNGVASLHLIGYENYASMLVEEVGRLLISVENRFQKITHLQYIKTSDNAEQIIEVNVLKAKDAYHHQRKRNSASQGDTPDPVVIIMPVGTTLSTVYKIKNALLRNPTISIGHPAFHNFALIIVGHDASQDATDSLEFPEPFWQMDPEDPQVVILAPENTGSEGETRVQWMFMPKTQWLRPDCCAICGTAHPEQDGAHTQTFFKHIPICQVDKTSTIPSLIFPVRSAELNHGIGFLGDACTDKNMRRLDPMKGCIDYGHIQRAANHYQFYIDFQKYYRKVQNESLRWLKTERKKIDQNGFNIIVSPLQPDNCLFVKDVLDHLFIHSVRFLYIPLHETFREEIRARFSYMAKEYRDACRGAIPPKYNVYYVDYSIVTGQSLRRAERLVRMILSDADAHAQINLFEKVILLTNRSSRDTVATIVQNPETDLLAFSTLCIPSYNTLGNHCPACDLVESYQTIAKCSATNELFQHFHFLAQKHKLRSLEDHRTELKKMHFYRQSYLFNFCQSLTHQLDRAIFDSENPNALLPVADAFKNAISAIDNTQTLSSLIAKNELTLHRVMEECDDNSSKLLHRYYKSLIDGRNWRRLICTHQAVSLIERIERLSSDHAEENLWDPVKVGKRIWDIMEDGLSKVPSKNVSDADLRYERREWLISYIKAFSREYPAKVAPVRSAIYAILEQLFMDLITMDYDSANLGTNMLGEFNYNTSTIHSLLILRDDYDNCELLQLYQLYSTLGKRLSDLQSNTLLHYSTLENVNEFLKNLRGNLKVCENSAPLNIVSNCLDINYLQTEYLHMLKWAAMSSSEEAKAFLLQNLSMKLSEVPKDENSVLISPTFGEVIRQENTRVLYSGIKRLNEIYNDTDTSWDNCMKNADEALKNVGWPDSSNGIIEPESLLVQNPLFDLIKYLQFDFSLESNSDQRQSIKELLAALLGFYRSMQFLENKSEREAMKDYHRIYLDICFYLAKIGKFKNACLVHKSNDSYTILSQHITENFEDVFETVRNILTYSENSLDLADGKLYNTVVQYSPEDSSISALTLALRIKRDSDITYWQKIFFVLFEQKDFGASSKQLGNYPHYLLFMRQRLQLYLERDLYALHHFKFSREDVAPINGGDEFTILHLTDLHISTDNKNRILNLINSNAEKLKEGNPEFIVVTGDVVQGNGSAVDLEENYKSAISVLTAIARILWITKDPTDEQKKMPFDWKKRIIIIPGNHDYSSMNELIASSTMRTTTMGVPMNRNGSPMSKYAYYIQFLQDFLDIDSRQSIRDNLNAVIEYPKYNLRFIALNSIAEVGPLRNNKVQLDEAFIDRIVADHKDECTNQKDECTNIYLAHHTCCYQPDYFQDRYWEKDLALPAIELAKKILQICLKFLSSPTMDGMGTTEEQLCTLKASKKVEYEYLTKNLSHSILANDILYLLDHWKETTNERCMHILSDYKLNQTMAETDTRTYHQRLNKLISSYPMDIMLGGHTHAAAWSRDISSPVKAETLKKEKVCIEGPRFYSAQDPVTLRYGTLTISGTGEKRMLKYSFFPSTPIYNISAISFNDKGTAST